MRLKSWNSKDFYAGVVFVFFGITALLVARTYPMGNAMRMGPGYMPTILGGILALLGLVIAARALWLSGEAISAWALRPLLLVLGAVLAFAVLVEPLGLVLAVLALVVTGCLGGSEFRLCEVAVLSLVLVVLAVAVFVYGLGLPFGMWPK